MPKKHHQGVIHTPKAKFLMNKPPMKAVYKIASRLKYTGATVTALDWVVNALKRYPAISEFNEDSIPSWIKAVYYMVPSIVVWGVALKDWITRNPKDPTPDTLSAKAFLYAIEQLPQTHKVLSENEAERNQFYELLQAFQYLGANLKWDIVLNCLLLFVRELHGFLFLLETLQITTKEKNQDITSITSDVYGFINMIYGITMMFQKIVREEKSTYHADKAFRTSVTVLKACNKFKSLIAKPHFHDDTPQASPLQSVGKFAPRNNDIKIDINNNLQESLLPRIKP